MFSSKQKFLLKQAVAHLERGGILVYPTETAYALGGDATNARTVRRIFKIKKRPLGKTLPLIAGSLAMVKKYCRLGGFEQRLAKKYWPGPLTLVLGIRNKESGIRKLTTGVVARDGTAAIRISGNKIAREMSLRLGRPIISTSANLSGGGECYSVPAVKKQLGQQPEIFPPKADQPLVGILDGGRLKKIKPSTMAKVRNNKIEILRQGGVGIMNQES